MAIAVFGYGRVSTNEQSSENQRMEIERSLGQRLEFWFADDNISGAVMADQRPQFQLLCQKIRDGEKLIVAKLDRLGRDAIDIRKTVDYFSERNIEVTVLNVGKLDVASPSGKAMLMMMSAFAEMERDLIRERTAAGLARAKALGKVAGPRPKTTSAQQAEIRAQRSAGTTVSALARQYKVSRGTILNIVNAGGTSATGQTMTSQ